MENETTETGIPSPGRTAESPVSNVLATAHRLCEALPGAVYVCAPDGTIIHYNRRAAELWGREPVRGSLSERFCGSWRMYRLDGGPLPHSRCPMADVLRTGTPVRRQDVVFERPDGTRVRARVSIEPLRDEAGTLIGAINCFDDSGACKEPEQGLRAGGGEPGDAFDTLPVPVHWIAPDGTILRANRAELELLGCAREDYVGRNIADFHIDGSAAGAILDRLARGERVERCAARLRTGSGDVREVLVDAEPFLRDGSLAEARCVTLDVTAERRAAELLGSLPVAVYGTDPAGRITFYNDAAAELWGCRPELGKAEFCGSWRLYHPDGTPMPHAECPMALALRERRAIAGAEAIAERPDGSRVHFLPYPRPLFDAAGHLAGAVNVLVDIGIQKQLEESAQRLAAIVESSDDAIVGKTLDGIVTSWNRGAQRLFGYSAQEAIGQSITFIIPAERRHEEPAILERIRRGERIEHYETVRRRKDGSLIDISLAVSPVHNAAGQIVGASKVARDISAEVQARRAIAESEARLRAVFDQVVAGLAETDLTGRFVRVNGRYCEITGYSEAELYALRMQDITHPEDLPRNAELFARLATGGPSFVIEKRYVRKDGSHVWVNNTVSLVREDSGHARHAIAVVLDITERKLAEARQELLNREIHHRTKNMFAVVQAVVTMGFAGKSTVAEAKDAVLGRLQSLAHTHAMLIEKDWQGAGIEDIVRAELAPYGDRIAAEGPHIVLPPRAAQNFALALHELATNAAKYGALSVAAGRVAIRWSITDDAGRPRLRFAWREHGGPPVTGPARKGFGSAVIEHVMSEYVDELPRIEFAPDGLRYGFAAPLDAITRSDRGAS